MLNPQAREFQPAANVAGPEIRAEPTALATPASQANQIRQQGANNLLQAQQRQIRTFNCRNQDWPAWTSEDMPIGSWVLLKVPAKNGFDMGLEGPYRLVSWAKTGLTATLEDSTGRRWRGNNISKLTPYQVQEDRADMGKVQATPRFRRGQQEDEPEFID